MQGMYHMRHDHHTHGDGNVDGWHRFVAIVLVVVVVDAVFWWCARVLWSVYKILYYYS